MLISVIIPTHNRREILKKSIESFYDQSFAKEDFELVVIDDHSSDGTEEMIASLSPPFALVYDKSDKRGPARARNIGIQKAQGEIILFIDSDIVAHADLLKEHMSIHKERGSVIVHGEVINTPNIDNPRSEKWKLSDYSQAFFATGNSSVAKVFLLKAGLFDEDFFEYGWEDLELGLRLKKMGLRAVKNSKAIGYHYQKPFRLENLPALCQKERERGHMAYLFYKKFPTPEVRGITLIHPFFFGLDEFLTVGNWTERASTMDYLKQLEEKQHQSRLLFLVKIIKNHCYMEGIREYQRMDKAGELKEKL